MKQTPTKKKNKAWLDFEKEIEGLYRDLGANDVEHNVDIAGNQIDLLAHVPVIDGTVSKHIISCKAYSTTVGVNAVKELYSVFHPLSQIGKADIAVLVTKTSFSKQAKSLADSLGIKLRTVEQLRWGNIDLAPYVKDIQADFATQRPFVNDGYIALTLVDEKTEKKLDATGVLKSFLKSRSARLLTVLGDSGAGKTTFCKSVFQMLGKRFIEDGGFQFEMQHASHWCGGGRLGPEGCLSGPGMTAAAVVLDYKESRLTASQPTQPAPPPLVVR